MAPSHAQTEVSQPQRFDSHHKAYQAFVTLMCQLYHDAPRAFRPYTVPEGELHDLSLCPRAVWRIVSGYEPAFLRLDIEDHLGSVSMRLTCGYGNVGRELGEWSFFATDAISPRRDPRQQRRSKHHRYSVTDTLDELQAEVSALLHRIFQVHHDLGLYATLGDPMSGSDYYPRLGQMSVREEHSAMVRATLFLEDGWGLTTEEIKRLREAHRDMVHWLGYYRRRHPEDWDRYWPYRRDARLYSELMGIPRRISDVLQPKPRAIRPATPDLDPGPSPAQEPRLLARLTGHLSRLIPTRD